MALRPGDLFETASSYLLTQPWGALDIAYIEEDRPGEGASAKYKRIDDTIRALGREVALNKDVFDKLAPLILRGSVGRVWSFGIGLANAVPDLAVTWNRMVEGFTLVPESERNPEIFRGFLNGAAARDANLVGKLLDSSIRNSVLGPFFVLLQVSVPIDEKGVARLLESIHAGLTPARRYGILSVGRTTEEIPSSDLTVLIAEISEIEDGYAVAVEIFSGH